MDQQIAGVLQQLATKLGTTAEYLWAVLLRQALIAGVSDILQYGLLVLSIYIYCRLVRRSWDQMGDALSFIAIIAGGTLAIISIVAFFSFPGTITAFVNPEYWALDRVLNAIKSH